MTGCISIRSVNMCVRLDDNISHDFTQYTVSILSCPRDECRNLGHNLSHTKMRACLIPLINQPEGGCSNSPAGLLTMVSCS